jgi:peptide/nickel transport system substrate-binding protein
MLSAGGAVLLAMVAAHAAVAQKSGGVLNISHFDSPASMSLHEEATAAAVRPMMGVFNNLVMYRQDVARACIDRTDLVG